MMYNVADSHEPLQGLASLRLSQGNVTEASELMTAAYTRIAAADQSIDSELRLAAVRILLECAPSVPKCADSALDLLSTMIREDDENVETHFLMGVAFFQQSPPDIELSREYLEKAASMLDAVRQSMAGRADAELFPYEAQVQLVKDQLGVIDAYCAEHPEDDDEVEGSPDEGAFEMDD
jgi:hypothetical protein